MNDTIAAAKGTEDAILDSQIDAVVWFIENPEALESVKDAVLKAYLKYIKKKVESEEQQKQALLPSGNDSW
jgi:hypothetical protein